MSFIYEHDNITNTNDCITDPNISNIYPPEYDTCRYYTLLSIIPFDKLLILFNKACPT